MSDLIFIPEKHSSHKSISSFSIEYPAEIERIAKRLREAKRRCGPKARGSDRWHYRDVIFEFASPLDGAKRLFQKLGPLPLGMSLDRIDPAGPYSLENIRYATPDEQTANREGMRRWPIR